MPRDSSVSLKGLCEVTVLRCQGTYIAAKVHSCKADGTLTTSSHNAGKYFHHHSEHVGSIHDLHRTLCTIASSPQLFVIRGKLNPDVEVREGTLVRRAKNVDPSEGEELPWFIEAPRRWVMLDFDKLPNPKGLDPLSQEAMRYLRSLLPPEFHTVSFSYSLSSSAGLSQTENLSAHLWFFLDRAVGAGELKRWLAQAPVDPALFNTVQPHFTAAPVFNGDLVDPVAVRKGLVECEADSVVVPDIPEIIVPASGHLGGQGLADVRGYAGKMAALGDGPGGRGCHGVITPAIAAYLHANGPSFNREALKADIRERAQNADWDPVKHSADYIAKQVSDAVLDASIDGWASKAFTIAEPYPITQKHTLTDARMRLKQAVDYWLDDLQRWQDRIQFETDLSKGLLQLGADGSGNLVFKRMKNPSKPFMASSPSEIRARVPPPRHAIAAQVGLGKTQAVIEALPTLLNTIKPNHSVLIAVPNHHLSRELCKRIQDRGIDAEIYYGPAQPDPETKGQAMCRRHEEYALYRARGLGAALCTVCEHSHHCGYLRQRSTKARVWIAAHNILYHKRQLPIPPVGALIIDEDPTKAGQEKRVIHLDELPKDVADAFSQQDAGKPFVRDDLRLSDQRLKDLAHKVRRSLEKVDLGTHATDRDIAEGAERLRADLANLQLAVFLDEVVRQGTFGMRLKHSNDHGLELHWHRQRTVHKAFNVPTLLLDATMEREVVRFIFDGLQPPPGFEAETYIDEDGSIAYDYPYPRLQVITGPTRIQAETPFATVRVVAFSGAASRFKDDKAGRRNIDKVVRYIEARAFGRRRVLVICQKALEKKLQASGLPAHVTFAHFNAVRGRDEWNDIDMLIVVGRTQPPFDAVELTAETLYKAPVATLGPDYYNRVWQPLLGASDLVPCERHPDPMAEFIRQSICEAELIQAIGRGRAVNRSQDQPLQIDIINTVPLPDVEVDEVLTWPDAQPTAASVIAGRHNIIIPSKTVKGRSELMCALLPDMFATPSAARQSKAHSQAETLYKKTLLATSAFECETGLHDCLQLIALRAPGCRYAVPAIAVRQPACGAAEHGKGPRECLTDAVKISGVDVLPELPRSMRCKMKSPGFLTGLFGCFWACALSSNHDR